MKKQIINKFWMVIVFCVFNLCLTAIAIAQPAVVGSQNDKVLVAGNPALKQRDVNELINFFEWLFEASFTAQQRTKFQALVINDWKTSEKAPTATAEILGGHRKFQALDAGRREKIRQALLPEIVASFKTEQSEVNAFLSEIHKSAGSNDGVLATNADVSDEGANQKGNGGSVTLKELAGNWSTGSLSGPRVKDLSTGELSPVGGTLIEYEISPNGQITYAGYSSNSWYSCTVQMFVYKTGRISINGTNITFDYAPGSRTNVPCAAAKREATIPAERKTLPFRLERDEHGVKLCTTENGAEFCIRKAS